MLTRVSIFATVAVLAAPAHTATINTIYRLNGNLATNTPNCPGLSLDVGLGTTTCTDSGNENNNLYMTEMAARADPLSFGVRASTSVVGDSSGGFIGGSSVGGTVSHNFLDTVFFPTTSGTWLLPIDVAGSLSVNKPPLGPSGGGGDVIAALNVSVTAGPTVTTIYDRWLQASTGPSDILDTVTGSLGTTVLALDFDNGKLDLQLSLFGQVGCNIRADGSFCDASLDFFQSARILGTTVLDNQGNVLADQTVTSLSGFDYETGTDPHDVAPIPLPAAGWMLLAGLSALIGISRKTARATKKT